jgi:hypothetical protein
MAKQRHRLKRLAALIGDPFGPSRREMIDATNRLSNAAREWIRSCIAAVTAGDTIPARTRTTEEIADAQLVTEWNRRHGVIAEGAREELRRRLKRIADRRREASVSDANAPPTD